MDWLTRSVLITVISADSKSAVSILVQRSENDFWIRPKPELSDDIDT